MKLKLLKLRFTAWLLLLFFYGQSQTIGTLQWNELSFANLPPSVKVFETNTPFPDGSPLHATYTVIDLSDPNLELLIDNVHPDGPRITPQQYADRQEEPVYVATNGGFFTNSGLSVNLLIQDGEFIARGQEGVSRVSNVTGRDTTYYPTWTAWGLLPDGTQEIVWTWPAGQGDEQFAIRFPEPYPNSLDKLPLPVPTLEGYQDDTTNIVGTVWEVKTATGGTPSLVVNGEIRVSEEELINCPGLCGKNPRTAIGYTADNQLILMVVDGRQAELSVGATLPELAQMMQSVGCFGAINLDGGGSSVMIADQDNVITNPSDAEGMRAVGSALLIKRKPQVYDTDTELVYTEVGDAWFASSNAGFFGESGTRLAPAGNGELTAFYVLPEALPAAEYELGAWWVGAGNRSSETPYIIKRRGFAPDTVRIDQSVNTGAFNLIGTYQLAPNDTIFVSNEVTNGDFVAIDAIRLRKTGEAAATVEFTGESRADFLNGQTANITALFSSSNTGVTLQTLRIFKSVNGEAEIQLGQAIGLNNGTADSFTLEYLVEDAIGDNVSLRFEIEDNRGKTVSNTFNIRVIPFEINFEPNITAGEHENGRTLAFDVIVDTQDPNINIATFNIYKSLNGLGEELEASPAIEPSAQLTYNFEYLINEGAGKTLSFRFEVITDQGDALSKTYTATIIPGRGAIRVAFINDINSSFGSTDYNFSVKNSVDFIANESGADLVMLVGDLIAGQSNALSRETVKSMWGAFNQLIKKPLDDAGVPIGVGLGNHDADPNVPIDREEAEIYWKNPANTPVLNYVDSTNFPFYHAFTAANGQLFCIALDGVNSGNTNEATLEWIDSVLQTPQAQNAKYRFMFSHLPLFASNNRYNGPGGVLNKNYELLELCQKYEVQTFVGAHHAAYYPGKRRGVDMLNLGEQARGGEALTNTSINTPTSTTIIDIFENDPFYGDSLVYTTFDLFDDFRVIEYEESPNAVFSFDGHLIRRDKDIFTSGSTLLSGLNVLNSNLTTANGVATARLEEDRIVIEGSFSNLEGHLLTTESAIAVYEGLTDQLGTPKYLLKVESTDGKNGTFTGDFDFDPDFAELLSIGFYQITIKTTAYPEGELRGQLYPQRNEAPNAATFTSHRPDSIFPIRDVLALYQISWTDAVDPNQDRVTYTYQLSRDTSFINPLISTSTSIDEEFKALTESDWYALLGDAEAGEIDTFYHRVIATDGKNITFGDIELLQLTKDNSPITEPVEIPAPNYKYDGVFANLPGFRVYDAAIDEQTGRVWTTVYLSPQGFQVFNEDGSSYRLTDPDLIYEGTNVVSINYQGVEYDLAPCYGVEWLEDGTVVVASDEVWKLDAQTGKVIAFLGGEQGSNPSADNQGRIFYHNVFPGRGARIIQQSQSDPGTFDIVSEPNISEGPGVARTSAFAPEGNVLYLPDAAAARPVYIYNSEDGLNFEFAGTFEMPAATGSNAIVAAPDSSFYVINNRSEQPPRLIFVDLKGKLRWDYFLEEVPDNDIRGFTISKDRRTILLGGEADVLYKYILDEPGPFQITSLSIKEAKAVNNQGNAINEGVYAQLGGVVNSPNFSADGLEFYFSENNEGIKALRFDDKAAYEPTLGDSIVVYGFLAQVDGNVQINVDSVNVISQNNSLSKVTPVVTLTESNESNLIQLDSVALVDPAQWTTGEGFFGFVVEVTNGTNTYKVLIDRESELFNQPAPVGAFSLTALVFQFDATAPLLDAYELLPRFSSDIQLLGNVTVMADRAFACQDEIVSFEATAQGFSPFTYQWFNQGVAIDGATNATFEASGLELNNLITVKITDIDQPYPYTAEAISINITPELTADMTDNDTTNNIALTFKDYEPWRAAITAILVDQDTIADSLFVVAPGMITLDASLFKEQRSYDITILAEEYCEVEVAQLILQPAPILFADTLNNNVGNLVELTFTDDGDWKNAISAIFIDGMQIDPELYQIDSALIRLDTSNFPVEGDYLIEIQATGYTAAAVVQTINPQLINLELNVPIAPIEVIEGDSVVTVFLGDLFRSPEDPNAEIGFELVENTRSDLYNVVINDDSLTLFFVSGLIGEGQVTLRGVSGLASAQSSFTVTVFAADLGKAYFLNEDASDEIINLGQPEALNFKPDSANFTIMAWFKVAAGEVGTIVAKAAGAQRQYQIFTFENEILYQVGGNSVATIGGNAVYTPDQWHHVALVVDNDSRSVNLYLDGAFIRSSEPGAVMEDSIDVLIGARRSSDASNVGSSAVYNGQIDEVSFWGTALSEQEVQLYYHQLLEGNEANLLAYYRFDQMGGSTITDLSGNGFTATVENGEDSDFVNSFAVLSDIPANYQNDIQGIWAVRPSSGTDTGLNLLTDIKGKNFAVFANNGKEGTTDTFLGGIPVTQLNRSWFVDRTGSSDVPATFAFDISNLVFDTTEQLTYVLLKSDDGQRYSFDLQADSLVNDVVYFSQNNLTDGYYTLAAESLTQRFGQALSFDGAELVNFGKPAELDFVPNQDNFTLTCWFKTVPGEVGTLIGKAGPSPRQYQIFTFADEILYQIGGEAVSTEIVTGSYEPNQWHHVALVVKNDSTENIVRLYVDGQFAGSSRPGAAVEAQVDVLLGARRATDENTGTAATYRGQIDEVSFWNIALTEEQVQFYQHQLLKGNEEGLLAYYRFDQESGDVLIDMGPNKLDGTLEGMEDEDWVDSYAALAELPEAYQNHIAAVWGAQTVDVSSGLGIDAEMDAFNFAVFGNNAMMGTSEISVGNSAARASHPDSTEHCIDSSQIDTSQFCPTIFDPVCGCNGVTYGNDCEAKSNGITNWTSGACTDKLTVEKARRNWNIFKAGTDEINSSLTFDLAALALMEWMEKDTFYLLSSQDASDFHVAALADSVVDGKVIFTDLSLANQYVSLAVNFVPNEAPIAELTASTLSGDAPLEVSFDARGSFDPDGTIVDYFIDLGVDSILNDTTASFTYEQPGEYTVVLVVVDNREARDTASVTVTVTAPNQMPEAILSADPISGEAPLQVAFDASASFDNDGMIISYQFDFTADSSLIIEQDTASFVYDTAGTYQVLLTVTDDRGGQDTASQSIVVDQVSAAGWLPFDGQDLHVQLYPNPASEEAVIQLEGNLMGTFQVSLFNAAGTLVQQYELEKNAQAQNQIMNVRSMPAGVYQLQIRYAKYGVMLQLVINK